ncbi:MAG: glycosyltransferase [Clostridia bacterium]|nr:glycosyltransferase [Clostridia bacterium]
MKQIVCLATSPWYPIPTRKQQVMSRIKDAEILYFDPSATVIAPLRDKSAKELMKKHRQPAVKPQENISVYSLPPVLPFFYKVRAINRLNQKRIARYIRKKMQEHGFEKPLLWVYSPVTVDAVDFIPHSGLVYDCVDRHSAYGGLMNPQQVDAMELELAAKTDQCFATADSLAERLSQAQPETAFIPNGANFERFVKAIDPQPLPEDMKDIPHPIFGFVGALQSGIEYGFVQHAAKTHPDWHFVWIGKEKPGVDLTELRAMPNCHFLGMKPNEKLPEYIAHFDACLNLFAKSDLSKDVSPLRFYEYLATGKPIVSTRQPDQVMQFENLIEIADTEEGFVQACESALADADRQRTEARIEEGRKSSWDSRVAQMCEILRKKNIL